MNTDVNVVICKHDWLYEPVLLCSFPPKQRKICKKCKKEVIETLGECQDYNEYYQIAFKRLNA